MTKNDLKVFCSWRHQNPWSRKNYTYATNGFSLIRIAKTEDFPDSDIIPKNVDQIIEDAVVYDLQPFPEIDGIKGKKCKDCKGTGKIVEVDCDECSGKGTVSWFSGYNDYEADCKGCDGTGGAKTKSSDGEICDNCNGTGIEEMINRIKINGFEFDSNLLYHFSLLPNAKIGAKENKQKDSGIAYIEFDGGVGIAMGLKY